MYHSQSHTDRGLLAAEAQIDSIDQQLLFAIGLEGIDSYTRLDKEFITQYGNGTLTAGPSMEVLTSMHKLGILAILGALLVAVVGFIAKLWEKVGGSVRENVKAKEEKKKEAEKKKGEKNKDGKADGGKEPKPATVTPPANDTSYKYTLKPGHYYYKLDGEEDSPGLHFDDLMKCANSYYGFIKDYAIMSQKAIRHAREVTDNGKQIMEDIKEVALNHDTYLDITKDNNGDPVYHTKLLKLRENTEGVYHKHFPAMWSLHDEIKQMMTKHGFSVTVAEAEKDQAATADEYIKGMMVVKGEKITDVKEYRGATYTGILKSGIYAVVTEVKIDHTLAPVVGFKSAYLKHSDTLADVNEITIISSESRIVFPDDASMDAVKIHNDFSNELAKYKIFATNIQNKSKNIVKETEDSLNGAHDKAFGEFIVSVRNYSRLNQNIARLFSEIYKVMGHIITQAASNDTTPFKNVTSILSF